MIPSACAGADRISSTSGEPTAPGAAAMRPDLRGSTWLTVAATAAGPAAWGTTYVVTTEWLPADRPLLAGTLRALPAGLVIIGLTRTLPKGMWWYRAAVLGLLNIGLFFALLFYSAYRLPGGVAATLGAAQPLLVALLAVPLLRQRLQLRSVVFGVAGVAGVAMMVLRGNAALDAAGVLAGLGGAASMALGIVTAKRWGRPSGVDVLPFTGWLLAAGGAVLLPVALVVEGLPPRLTAVNVGGFGYLALVNTTLAYWLWLRGIDRLPAKNVAFMLLVAPAVAVLIGVVVLHEHLAPIQVVGLLLALGSMVLAQLQPTPTAADQPRSTQPRPSHQSPTPAPVP
jgi:probable blue pigment (indigoidine) exporter